MDQAITFSVIIPVYNAEKYLRPALDSVLAQAYTNWECVCVDDGSTDASATILDEYANRDKRFRIVHQVNGGEGVARNTGLRAARGDWITWLDADDIYALDRLAEAMRLIELEQPDMVRFRTYMGRESDRCFGSNQIQSRDYRVIVGTAAKEWGWNVLMPAGMVWTWAARRELLGGIDFVPGMRVKVDSIYCGYLANRLNKVVQSEYQAYFYRYIASSAIHGVRRADDCLRLLRAVMQLFQECQNSQRHVSSALREVMLQRLRMHCECDIIDWVLKRNGEYARAKDIFVLYNELKSLGVFACKSIQQKRYRLPMEWWEKTGQIWPIEIVGRLVRFYGLLRRSL